MPTVTKAESKHELQSAEHLAKNVAALARLLDQTMADIQGLNPEFDERLTETTNTLQTRFEHERGQLRSELERMRQAAAEWEAERTRLVADYEQASRLLEETRHEHNRALAESDEAASIALERQIASAVDRARAELLARWDLERAHLVAERNRAQQRLAEAAAEHEVELAEAVESVRTKLQQELDHARTNSKNDVIHSEISRVEGLIRDVAHEIDNPETELSVVIRKHAERAELESYLRGVRFALVR
jgi:hypothetical protein